MSDVSRINRNYKDRLFKFIFGNPEKKELTLSLYNAMNNSSYTDPDAISLNTIEDAVYMGMVKRTDTPMPAGTWMYRDSDEYRYDPDKARALLDEAGWKADPERDNGVRHATVTVKGESKDRRLRLRLYVYEEQDNAVRLQVAQRIQDYLAAVGIEVAITVESFTQVREHLRRGISIWPSQPSRWTRCPIPAFCSCPATPATTSAINPAPWTICSNPSAPPRNSIRSRACFGRSRISSPRTAPSSACITATGRF